MNGFFQQYFYKCAFMLDKPNLGLIKVLILLFSFPYLQKSLIISMFSCTFNSCLKYSQTVLLVDNQPFSLVVQTMGEVVVVLGMLRCFAQWSFMAPSLIRCVFDVLMPELAACLPNESIQAASPQSNPLTMSYLGRFLNSSWRSLRLRSILIFFMQPSSGQRSTLSAGTNSL